jgi:hypothetical protein
MRFILENIASPQWVTPCHFPDPTESTGLGNWHELTPSVSPS